MGTDMDFDPGNERILLTDVSFESRKWTLVHRKKNTSGSRDKLGTD
jgi:hypothetical protein